MKKEVVAVFDFDKTITNRDSMIDFIYYYFGKKAIVKFILLAPTFLSFKLNILSRGRAKEKMINLFFKGESLDVFQEKANKYAEDKIDSIVKSEALEKIKWHKANNHRLVIISASLNNWIKPWALKNGFEDVVSTEAEIVDNKLTGLLKTENCYGPEKKRRFFEYMKVEDKSNIYLYMYGDSNGDKEMLEIADEKFYRKF